jgi:hypothetical protein
MALKYSDGSVLCGGSSTCICCKIQTKAFIDAYFEEIRWPEGAKANMAAGREDNLEKA